MSGIPSNIAISSLQAAYQARNLAEAQQQERGAGDAAGIKQVQAANRAGETVSVEDEDTAVFADSQGTGSEGRSTEDQREDDEPHQDAEGDGVGAHSDHSNAPPHLDIRA